MAGTERNAFPLRSRDTNVALIRGVLYAQSEAEFRQGRVAFAAGLHPSLFAELDWMESQVPAGRRAGAIRHVDGLFFDNLPALLAARVDGLDLGHADVQQNRDFYAQVVEDAELADVVGAERTARIREALGADPVPLGGASARGLRLRLAVLTDARHVPVLAQVAVSNAVLYHLDHLPSRLRTKRWMREAFDSALPRIPWGDPVDDGVVERFREAVAALDAGARQLGLGRLYDVTQALAAVTGDIAALTRFGGELQSGLGPCGRCAMLFASTALASLDPTCPMTCKLDDDTIFVPEFNLSTCPFCGHVARVDAPALFHAPSRGQVIYCVPSGGLSDDEAIEQLGPILRGVRERYRARLDPEAAARLDGAAEVITHDVPGFLRAIQLGHTATEWHAWLVVRMADGSGMISDPTKNIAIALTPEELREHWRAAGPEPIVAPDPEQVGDAPAVSVTAGRVAYSEGRYDDARTIFERALALDPTDTVARTNLATVYLRLGDEDRARAVLTGR